MIVDPGLPHTAGGPALGALAARPETRGFLSPTGVEIVFVLVGVVVLAAAVTAVTTKRLVHSALWLVVALGGIAVEYLLLTAEFIAWVQVLIYVGSIVVLILFGLMLTRAPMGPPPARRGSSDSHARPRAESGSDADSGNRWVALPVALATAATLVTVVIDAFRTSWIDVEAAVQGSAEATGAALFRNWVLPFEALSVLLLAALVGAIVLSRRGGADTAPEDGSDGSGGPDGPDGSGDQFGQGGPDGQTGGTVEGRR